MIYVDENIPFSHESFGQLGPVKTFPGRTLTRSDLLKDKVNALMVRSVTKVNK